MFVEDHGTELSGPRRVSKKRSQEGNVGREVKRAKVVMDERVDVGIGKDCPKILEVMKPGPSTCRVSLKGGPVGRKKKLKAKMVVEYDVSSGDEMVDDPIIGKKWKGCGYFFPTAPKALMTQFLTRDDNLKLKGCNLPRKIKKFERNFSWVTLPYSDWFYFFVFCYYLSWSCDFFAY